MAHRDCLLYCAIVTYLLTYLLRSALCDRCAVAVTTVDQSDNCEEGAGGPRARLHERPACRERVRSCDEGFEQERSLSAAAEHAR